jgi:hypothetical protein
MDNVTAIRQKIENDMAMPVLDNFSKMTTARCAIEASVCDCDKIDGVLAVHKAFNDWATPDELRAYIGASLAQQGIEFVITEDDNYIFINI